MTIRIECRTIFDITATGVRGQFRESQMPLSTEDGQTVQDFATWNRARNQQRNWETLNQLISLRTLPENITIPQHDAKTHSWAFEFDVTHPETISIDTDALGLLLKDCLGVPMIQGLAENINTSSVLEPQGEQINIWFSVIANK
jgi:hypothetical protein